MRAKVIKDFAGCRDGECITEVFSVGQIVIGDLAEVAVGQEWAEEVDEDQELDPDDVFEHLKDMTVAQLRDMAGEHDIELATREKKNDLIAKITDVLSENSGDGNS